MKRATLLLIIATQAFWFFTSSCGGSDDKKASSADTLNIGKDLGDTAAVQNEKKEPGNVGRSVPPVNEKDKILANIDQYLVSKMTDGILTVENTLSDATILKAYAEVTAVNAGGQPGAPDYYILQNIEPGGTKSVRLKNNKGTVCHIVKLKSDELTGGETILVGSHYVPK